MTTRRKLTIAWVPLLAAVACSDAPTEPDPAITERNAGEWKTWVLEHGGVSRPPPPPVASSAETSAELEEIIQLQASRTAGLDSLIRKWDPSPTAPWTHLAIDLIEFYTPLLPEVRLATPARSGRIMALLHVAMYDALVATWDAKYAYNRPPPFTVNDRVDALGTASRVPSYPSEHAAAAAAAMEILRYTFPKEDAERFEALAREAGESRIAAGLAYRSDVEAGWALGRAVAHRVIEHARRDGSHAEWNGSIPEGHGMWRPTSPRYVQRPFDPLAGSWKPWVLPSGDVFRPAPHPPVGSEVFERDLEELRRLSTEVTAGQADIARYWATDAPSTWWELFMLEEVRERGMGPVHAARAHALLSIAIHDAYIACWDGKFHYWLVRPITMDSTIVMVYSAPPFPSYPSGHSTISTAAAEVFAHLFPDAAAEYRETAHEASLSRVWGGVHYRFDIIAGEELGRRVGEMVVARAREDGAGG